MPEPETETEPTPFDDQPDWLEVLRARVSEAQWAEIIDLMVAKAAKGDMKAVEFLERGVLPKERGDSTGRKVKEVRLVYLERKV